MKWVTAALVSPAQTMSGVITAGSSGESGSAQSSGFHYTHTHTSHGVNAGDREPLQTCIFCGMCRKMKIQVQLIPNIVFWSGFMWGFCRFDQFYVEKIPVFCVAIFSCEGGNSLKIVIGCCNSSLKQTHDISLEWVDPPITCHRKPLEKKIPLNSYFFHIH